MKRIIFAMLVSILFIFGACGGNTDVGTPNYAPYVGGNDGITFKFAQGMPSDIPGAIGDNGNEFAIGVEITNSGEYDINAETEDDFLQVELKGIKAEYFGVQKEDLVLELTEDLLGSKKNIDGSILKGDFTTLIFEDLSYKADIQGDLPITFMVDLCYDYGTKSSTRVCVADNVNEALTNDICEISATQTTMNSAGPVQITNLRQGPMGGSKISVVFDVVRIGTGDLFLYEGTNQCDYDSKNTDKDKVKIVVSLPDQSTADLECSGFEMGEDGLENVMNVYRDGPTTVNCKITGEEGDEGIYLETLSVDLFYRYNEQISKSVVVKDTGTAN